MAYTKRQQREWHNNFKAAYETSELETIPGKEVVTIERLADDASTRSRPYEDENAPEIAFLLEGDGLREPGSTSSRGTDIIYVWTRLREERKTGRTARRTWQH